MVSSLQSLLSSIALRGCDGTNALTYLAGVRCYNCGKIAWDEALADLKPGSVGERQIPDSEALKRFNAMQHKCGDEKFGIGEALDCDLITDEVTIESPVGKGEENTCEVRSPLLLLGF